MDSMAVHWRNLHHVDLCHNSKDQSIALVPVIMELEPAPLISAIIHAPRLCSCVGEIIT